MGHRQAQERVGDRVDQVKTADVRVEQEAPEDSACRVSRTRWHVSAGDAPEGATRGWFGGIAGKTIGGRFPGLGLKTWGVVWWLSPENHRWPVSGFGPQNPGACGARRFPGLGLKTRAEVPKRTGRHVAASGGLRRGEAKDEEGAWPSDHLLPLHRVGSQAAARGGSLIRLGLSLRGSLGRCNKR